MRIAVLLAATTTAGIMAGFFYAYPISVMPALRRAHIPMNNRLDAAGEPGRVADPEAARRWYEARWVRWNHARTLLCTGSFVAYGWALTQV
jgi:uncharacterized membrane protein